MNKIQTKIEQKVLVFAEMPRMDLRKGRLSVQKDMRRVFAAVACLAMLLTLNGGWSTASAQNRDDLLSVEGSLPSDQQVIDGTEENLPDLQPVPEVEFVPESPVPDPTVQGEMIFFDPNFMYNNGFSGETPEAEPVAEGQIKVACVGDSLTYGYGVMMWEENNYPTQLQNMLGDEYHVQNFGVSNYCVKNDSDHPYTTHTSYTDSLLYGADILVFMMGTNDAKAKNWTSAEDYKAALLELLDSYGDVQVVLCTPSTFYPDGVSEEGVSVYGHQLAQVEEVCQVIREVAQERGYLLVDFYEMSLSNPQWFCIDGVHLNVEGATAIAEAVNEAVSKITVNK